MHLHGALGISNEMPFSKMMVQAQVMAIADGPTEVHRGTVARQVLRAYEPFDEVFPSTHLPTAERRTREQLSEVLELAAAEG